ncbi:MAG: envelope stress response membrane protein PspB [Xanthomonadales bacterium]|jgi:phage shock protein B|nr:envelope stress response membrane protein PspB [Xanthomonadales bacterium]
MGELFGILFLTIVAPIWIVFHYIYKMRSVRGLSTEDEKMLSDLWETSRRMEDRIHTLERILDSESPDWRRQQQ